MFCQRCGTALPGGANFCPNCGTPTGATPGAGPPPAPASARVFQIETCVVRLRWQEGAGFVPGWFEAGVSGPGGDYIADQSPAFQIIPGDAFWLNTHDAKTAHSGLVTALAVAGWQHIGQTSTDWWSAEFRRHV